MLQTAVSRPCPKCFRCEWRVPASLTADCAVDNHFRVYDVGFDYTDPEPDKDKVYCDHCGYEPRQ